MFAIRYVITYLNLQDLDLSGFKNLTGLAKNTCV
jgi:hypothetical protein